MVVLCTSRIISYLNNLLKNKLTSDTVSIQEINRRKTKIKKYFDSIYNKTNGNQTDFNVLLNTYNSWYKIFPFEISFFNKTRAFFENALPFSTGIKHTNKYTGLTTVKLHTKDELINQLFEVTKSILLEINTLKLYEQGLLTEPEKIKLEIIVNERKKQLENLYINTPKSEYQQFRKILKKWFADEKKFIDEITPLLPKEKANTNKAKFPEKFYALYHCVLIEMGKEKHFEKDRITGKYNKPEIMKFGVNRYKFKTQGQLFYNTYIETDLTNKTAIAKSYGKDYKKKLIEISNNDADFISHLKKYPN